MKRIIVITSVLCILALIISMFLIPNKNTNLLDTQPIDDQFDSIIPCEQVYYNLFITMLYPYVEDSIADYYNEYMTHLPGEAPYSYKFIRIEKTPGFNYSYTLELEVQPYVGPHLSVGRDRITFKIDLNEVEVEKFEHIESHELPPHYQDILKKNLPNT